MRGQDFCAHTRDHLGEGLLEPQASPGHRRPPIQPFCRGLREGLVGEPGVGWQEGSPPSLPLPATPLQVLQEEEAAQRHSSSVSRPARPDSRQGLVWCWKEARRPRSRCCLLPRRVLVLLCRLFGVFYEE